MKINAPAKVNLTLNVLAQDGDYHLIDTIIQEIDLTDELTIQPVDEDKIKVTCNHPKVPTNDSNLAYQAAALIKDRYSIKQGVNIIIHKKIPPASGLGGGSSNAAATLKALNDLWKLSLSNQDLKQLAAEIGMDAPFFIEGGTARCTHYGEKVTPIDPISLPRLMIVLDEDKLSTKEMYQKIDAKLANRDVSTNHTNSDRLINNPSKLELLQNDFDALISTKNISLQKKLLHLGAEVVHICGSGPALYALFRSDNRLQKAFRELKGQVRFIWQA